MPKLLVLVDSGDDDVVARAREAAHAARHVRFTEVDVRATHDRQEIPALTGVEAIMTYDGILVAADATLSADASALLRQRAGAHPTTNAVFAVIGGMGALAEVATLGGLVVTATGAGKPQAEALGAKAAKVIAWVRHALGHEADAGTSEHGRRHHDHGTGEHTH